MTLGADVGERGDGPSKVTQEESSPIFLPTL